MQFNNAKCDVRMPGIYVVSASVLSVLAPARSVISSVYGTYDMSSFIVVVVQGLCELFMSYLNVKVGEAISV